MTNEARGFLRDEYESLHKLAYESQFNHFMGVFYFWIAVVTLPGTAGLIAGNTTLGDRKLGLLLVLLATIGVFLSAKMFDIRCSQLQYIFRINEVRYHLHAEVKSALPADYELPFQRDKDLRHVALTDFGMAMAVVMSLVNGAYAFGAASLLGSTRCGATHWGSGAGVFCLGLYVAFVLKRISKPAPSPNPPMPPTDSTIG